MVKKIPVFLSVGTPHNDIQQQYLETLEKYLFERDIDAQSLGRNFWSIENPLKPVQRKMREVYGAVIIAMERFHSFGGRYKEGSPSEKEVKDQYFAMVWTHIEAAMVYQLELPLLILKEEKLVADGMFDPGIHEWMVIRIKPEDPDEIKRNPMKSFIDDWIERVRECYYRKNS